MKPTDPQAPLPDAQRTASALPALCPLREASGGTPRVLLVRLSAIGDCLQTIPLAWAIRERFPAADVTWVVERPAAALVALCPAVDRLVVVPRGFSLQPRTLWRLRRILRQVQPQIALDPQGLTKSGLVAWLSGAQRRIGLARPAAREINPWLQTEHVVPRQSHRVWRYLELLRPLGGQASCQEASPRFGLTIPLPVQQAMHQTTQRLAGFGPIAVLNPGAGWDSKRWPTERYAEVARHLGRRGVRSVVAWGGAREKAWAEAIVAAAAPDAVLAPPTSLVELAAMLKQAALFVGSDTGPLHLAAAVGTPCVGLFGASSAQDCGPLGDQHILLQKAHDVSPGRKRPGADNWAMRRIEAAEVCVACDRLLDRMTGQAA